MAKEKWVCRMWTETPEGEWLSEFETFATKEEAEEMGKMHCALKRKTDWSREYEVYKA